MEIYKFQPELFFSNSFFNKENVTTMKKYLVLAMAAITFAACEDREVEADELETATTATTGETMYTPADGDVTYRENKVKVMRNGEWVDVDDEIELENGVVVMPNGRVRQQDKEIELEDGEIVNRTGNFFDRSGRAVEDAWNATKDGAKEAGRAVGNAAEKAGEKLEGIVDKDAKHD